MNNKYPCECLDLSDIVCEMLCNGRVRYDQKAFRAWEITFINDESASLHNDYYECGVCGEGWEKQQIEDFAINNNSTNQTK